MTMLTTNDSSEKYSGFVVAGFYCKDHICGVICIGGQKTAAKEGGL